MGNSDYVHYVAHLEVKRVTREPRQSVFPQGGHIRSADVPKSDRDVFDVLTITVKASTPANLALKIKAHLDAEDIPEDGAVT